ncbi:MAG: thiamine phosphate synthase [Caldiserica bacterium]|nr:thiamine phosphate synthase [Caldisericota bacterium]
MWQIIDVNYNRAREGIRVVEEVARFILKDTALTQELRKLRHSLQKILASFSLYPFRNAETDIGKDFSSLSYTHLSDLVKANFSRVEESLRVMEEFSRLEKPALSRHLMDLRFLSYQLEKRLLSCLTKKDKLSKIGIYLITDERVAGKPYEEIVEQALEGGIRFLQFRDKTSNTRELWEKSRRIRELTRKYSAVLIINDRVDIALSVGADGVHLGREDLPVKEARKIMGEGKIVGVTVRSPAEAIAGIKEGADYVSLGPIFPTTSKKGLPPPLGLEALKKTRKAVEGVIVAVGGITLPALPALKKAGADGVAVISGILAESDIKNHAQEWVKAWGKQAENIKGETGDYA